MLAPSGGLGRLADIARMNRAGREARVVRVMTDREAYAFRAAMVVFTALFVLGTLLVLARA